MSTPRALRTDLESVLGSAHVGLGSSADTLIAAPGSAAEVAEVVRVAARYRAAVIPRGTRMRETAAAEPQSTRVVVDMRRLGHVLRLDETSLVVEVQAGLTAIELERILAKRHLSLGDYPPTSLTSSIGGLLAVRTPGKLSRRHGFMEDAVLGISAVLADGRTIHTRVAPRRASGPDLARALCGSEGTLGIITSAVLRIHRRPESRMLSAFELPSFDDAISAVNLALRDEAAPAAMRIYDAPAARLHLGDLAGQAQALLLVATAGPTDLAACDRDLIASAATAVGGQVVAVELAEAWWNARIGAGPQPHAPHLQVSATPSSQRGVVSAVRGAMASEGIVLGTYASRFDLDGAVLFFLLTDESGAPLTGERLESARDRALDAARRAGAYLLGGVASELQPYFSDLRQQLDPGGILNPDCLVPGR